MIHLQMIFRMHSKRLQGGRSVPRVFIGGKFIGGGDDTQKYHDIGKLKDMLKEAGALKEEL